MPIPLDPPYLPEIPGDPAGMTALASTLRGHAGAVGGLASGVESHVNGMSFEGPAADDLRSRVGAVGDQYRAAADRAPRARAAARHVGRRGRGAAAGARAAARGHVDEYNEAQRRLSAGPV